MSQTIDLRKKELVVPKPEPVVPADEQVLEAKPTPEVGSPTGNVGVAELEPITVGVTSWLTHLSPPTSRERIWYIVGILGISAVLVAYLTHDFLFTIILILAGFILLLNAYRPHHPHQITVHATGISINDEHHHFADMKSFWIDYQPHIKEISIELKKGYSPIMKIPLEDANPLEIRQAMISYVPEREHEQSLLDHIVRLIRI